jgi:uncharacterized protein YdaU (DUF1376 family)
MNYIELHLGDYEKSTAHLSACEDGIYGRLLRRYYDTELPLPADVKAVQRLVRARTREEKNAVATVLTEFFYLKDEGYRNTRCDEEIARFQDKRKKAASSANARWQKKNSSFENDANAYEMHAESECVRIAMASETHAERNALQSPDTNHQSPDKEDRAGAEFLTLDRVQAEEPPLPATKPNQNGTFAMFLDWQPGDQFDQLLRYARLANYPWEDELPEFVLYRLGQSERMSQGSWEHKFIQSLKRNAAQRNQAGNEPTQIPVDWEPDREIVAALLANGITRKFLDSELLTFTAFWRDAGNFHRSWNAKFIDHVQRNWAQQPNVRPSTFDNLTDRSWAVGVVPDIGDTAGLNGHHRAKTIEQREEESWANYR